MIIDTFKSRFNKKEEFLFWYYNEKDFAGSPYPFEIKTWPNEEEKQWLLEESKKKK